MLTHPKVRTKFAFKKVTVITFEEFSEKRHIFLSVSVCVWRHCLLHVIVH